MPGKILKRYFEAAVLILMTIMVQVSMASIPEGTPAESAGQQVNSPEIVGHGEGDPLPPSASLPTQKR